MEQFKQEKGVETMEAGKSHEQIMAEISQDTKLQAGYEFAKNLNPNWAATLAKMSEKKLENLKSWLETSATYDEKSGKYVRKERFEPFHKM
jgi:hypothetical protein